MNVTHDLIAAVSGPGWKYGLSRILIDDEGNGAVFIAGSETPFATFTVDHAQTSRGKGHNDEGEITWRRRGSSCQYKLAKCKVSTETMRTWWLNAQIDEIHGDGAAAALDSALADGSVFSDSSRDLEELL